MHPRDEGAEGGGGERKDNTQQLSKNALKRLKRMEHKEKVKQLKKQQERERKAMAKEDKLALIAERNAGLSEEERRAEREARQARARAHRAEQVKEKEERAARLKKAKEDDEYRVVIDYDFEAYMTEGEMRSIVQQTNFSYGANGRAAVRQLTATYSLVGSLAGRLARSLAHSLTRSSPGASPPHSDVDKGQDQRPVREAVERDAELARGYGDRGPVHRAVEGRAG